MVPVPQAPLPQAPSPVWTYELAGEAPVGPVLTAQGLLCTDNNADGAGTAFLRSVDLQTGQVSWSYDVRKQSRPGAASVIPSAVGVYGQTALVGVQTTDETQVEIHGVDVATGAPGLAASRRRWRTSTTSSPVPWWWAAPCTPGCSATTSALPA